MGEGHGWGKPIHYYTPASQTDSTCIVVDGLAPSMTLPLSYPSATNPYHTYEVVTDPVQVPCPAR